MHILNHPAGGSRRRTDGAGTAPGAAFAPALRLRDARRVPFVTAPA